MKKFLVGLLLLLAGTAGAGTVAVEDNEGILKEVPSMVSAMSQLDFDVQILTSSSFKDRAQFNLMVERRLKDANSVVVGMDSVHRWSRLRVGANVRVPFSSLDAIAAYGNPFFKQQKYEAGLQAIVEGIGRSVVPVQRVSEVPARPLPGRVPQPEESSQSETGWWLAGILGLCGLLGGFALWQHKRNKKEDEERERARTLANARFNESMLYKDYVAPVVRTNYPGAYVPTRIQPAAIYAPPPQPVVVTHNNSNPVLDYLLIDNLVHGGHVSTPDYTPPRTPEPDHAPAPYRAPDPEPTPSYSSGGSDYSSSSSDSGSSSFDFGSSDSGGSSW